MRAVRDIKGNAMKLIKLLTAGVFAGLAVTTGQASASVLDTVKQRGTLNCGTDNTAPGFGYLNTTTGQMEGLDVDFCRAVAAAVLGDASKVKFVTVTQKPLRRRPDEPGGRRLRTHDHEAGPRILDRHRFSAGQLL